VLDPGPALHPGTNDLAVRVVDPPVGDPELLRSAHGKQGWANHVFPSRPSLYLTYGGIWQPVTLRRHGPIVVDDLFLNGDPDDLVARVAVTNRSPRRCRAAVTVRAVGVVRTLELDVEPSGTASGAFELGPTRAARWRPDDPVLHHGTVDVTVDGILSDSAPQRFGVRTVRRRGSQIFVNGAPYRMKSALVQGFRAEELYGAGTRAQIEAEVQAARAMGFNTLRLHIKAFEPAYLDVCDELGMLLHCDIPVAEPVTHEELGSGEESGVAARCVAAVQQQICRDRNHPSIILWSVMNELGLDRTEVRGWDRYERFAHALVDAARTADGTRPIIENDWIEPDPERVFVGDVLTAHWYGRLHAEYLEKIDRACEQWASLDRPLFVTEFGDWGLPEMPELTVPPFWDSRAIYMAGLAETLWPATIARFVGETQRYQGLSDRLQAEVFRRHDNIGGYCLTELTDVPQELNGLLDLNRRPKPLTVAEVARVNQPVLPILALSSLVISEGELLEAPLHIANDGPALEEVTVEARFGDTGAPIPMERLLVLDTSDLDDAAIRARFEQTTWARRIGHVDAHRAALVGNVSLPAPRFVGSHDLILRVCAEGELVAENRYPIHVIEVGSLDGLDLCIVGDDSGTATALSQLGATVTDHGMCIVGEGALDDQTARDMESRLRAGETVVVLAQPSEHAAHFPLPLSIRAVATEWGSSVFHFTTDSGALPGLPRRNVLTTEDSTVQAGSVVTDIDGQPFPEVPVVIAYKPVPDSVTGTVVGSHPVGAGRLVFCQYRLCAPATRGDAAAQGVLTDLLQWAACPRPMLRREQATLPDGRATARYRHTEQAAR
jgi:hypothetical protein